jgi:hypothetical protein
VTGTKDRNSITFGDPSSTENIEKLSICYRSELPDDIHSPAATESPNMMEFAKVCHFSMEGLPRVQAKRVEKGRFHTKR